jgi:hypothetical protein
VYCDLKAGCPWIKQLRITAKVRRAIGTFDQARAEFEAAWAILLSKRTEADFQEWRDQRDWTAEKYRRFDRGERMPPDWKPSRHATG